jgi:hypothetical protein
MSAAQEESVKRINDTFYLSDKIDAYVAPKTMDWVFDPNFESVRKNFLGKNASYQMENNFIIKPSGPIWGKLYDKYGLVKDKAINAYRLLMNTNDPNISTEMHYAFATYRTDDS